MRSGRPVTPADVTVKQIMATKTRLLVLNQYYWPGVEATAYLLSQLCEKLADEFVVDLPDQYKTVIGEGAFVGSDTMLVAPVNIGKGAKTGAGSVVTHDVPDGAVAFGVPARVKKTNDEG